LELSGSFAGFVIFVFFVFPPLASFLL